MYKSIPKKLKEEKNIDAILQDVHAYMNIGKAARIKGKAINMNVLKPQVEQFIEYAYMSYYNTRLILIIKMRNPNGGLRYGISLRTCS